MAATPESLAFVNDTIQTHKVVVFSKSQCPFCKKAKAALAQFVPAESIHSVELDLRSDIIVIQNALNELTGARSVPRVFIDGKFIGGGDDTARKAEDGTLKQLLEAAGAV